MHALRQSALKTAYVETRASWNTEDLFRRWIAGHGGVYVLATEKTPPNLHLSHLADRDAQTPSGKPLTLMNGAYMMRQLHELAQTTGDSYRGHLASLQPIQPENVADPWERNALQAFVRGESEVSGVAMVNGEPHMRLMRPLVTEQTCLKCHAQHGYQSGDIRGGISVSVPMAPLWNQASAQVPPLALGHGLIWMLGLVGIGATANSLGKRSTERVQAEKERERLLDDMAVRIRELRCMHGVTDSIRKRSILQDVFQDAVLLLPAGWHDPEITRGRIHFDGRDYFSGPFEPTSWFQRSDIIVDGERRGFVEVCYLAQRPDRDEGPFSKEERRLIDSVAHALGAAAERERALAAAAARTIELERRTVELEKSRRVALGMMEDAEQARRVLEGAQAALRASEERFRIAAQSASDVIWEWDIVSGRLEWFGAIDALLGYAPGEFLRTIEAWEGIIHPDDHDRVMRLLDQHLRTHAPYLGEYCVCRKDGTFACWTDRGEALWDERGNAYKMVGVCTDITERKRAEDGLRETNHRLEETTARANDMAARAEMANVAKSEFLANMSHEIRTPMTAILGYAENLFDPDLSDSEKLDAVHTIRRNGEHLLTIINDILDISKIEAGKLEVERIRCSPIQLVAEVKSLMQVRADAKNLALHGEFIGAIPETITSDPTRLKQILVNLVGNAIKFTETGGVRLITRFVDDGAEPIMQFDVLDTGLGMKEEQMGRLFQPFTQADTSTTRRFGGTGLGLAISKRCAEMLGGDLAVVETQEGIGTRFRVTVAGGSLDGVRMIENPMPVAHVAVKGAETTKGDGERDLRNRRVLVAEDNPTNRALVMGMLKKAGIHVTAVENGKLAADAALAARHKGGPFDVVLMDIQMPVMGGYEATALLRQEGYTGPIIALTAHAMEGDRQKCITAGCDDYIAKPIDRNKLVAMIREYVGRARERTDCGKNKTHKNATECVLRGSP